MERILRKKETVGRRALAGLHTFVEVPPLIRVIGHDWQSVPGPPRLVWPSMLMEAELQKTLFPAPPA